MCLKLGELLKDTIGLALKLLRGIKYQAILLREIIRIPYQERLSSNKSSRLINQVEDTKTILFFTPEAGVELYIKIQAFIARTLKELGYNVIFVRCFENLPRCPVKDMVLLPYEVNPSKSHLLCLRCLDKSSNILDQYKLDYIDIRELLSEYTIPNLDEIVRNLREEMLEFSYEGINVGRLAFYDFSIVNKHPLDKKIIGEAFDIYEIYVRNAIISIEIFKAIISKYKISYLVSFDEYAMMTAVRLCAKSMGIKSKMVTIAYHLNGDARRIVITNQLTIVKELEQRRDQWKHWQRQQLSPKIIEEIMDDLIYRMSKKGSHIYSTNKSTDILSVKSKITFHEGRKVLVAYTSSRDEYDALLNNLHAIGYDFEKNDDAFSNTFEWLDALINHVEKSKNLQLIIRIHPRVGKTNRDNLISGDYLLYREAFSKAYNYCQIIWPEDKISSYDLAEMCDVALISWSSIGLELARMGVPVLSGNPSFIPIAPEDCEFIRIARNRDEYFSILNKLLFQNPTIQQKDNIINAYRWYYMFQLGNSIDVSDVITDRSLSVLPKFRLAKNAKILEGLFTNDSCAMDFNLINLERLQLSEYDFDERRALIHQLNRLMSYLITGKDIINFSQNDKFAHVLERDTPAINRLKNICSELGKVH